MKDEVAEMTGGCGAAGACGTSAWSDADIAEQQPGYVANPS